MYKNKSYVTLYNLPIELSSVCNINWGLVGRDRYLDSIEDQITYDDFTDLYRGRAFSIPGNSENLRKYNYMKIHYENEVDVNKDFYCFVENYQYISQEVSVPIYGIDYHTTYGVYEPMDIHVERETPDMSKDKYLTDLEMLPPRYKVENIEYDTSRYYVVCLNKSVTGTQATGKITFSHSGETITEFNMNMIYVLCTRSGLASVLNNEHFEYVEYAYSVTGYQLGNIKSEVDSKGYVYVSDRNITVGQTVNVNTPSGYNNFLNRYPYFYVTISDITYDPMDFKNKKVSFAVFPTFVMELGITYIPIDYKGEKLNKSYAITINPSAYVGGNTNYRNSLAYKEASSIASATSTLQSQLNTKQKELNTVEFNYANDLNSLNNKLEKYEFAKLGRTLAEQQDVMGFGLGGARVISQVFKALGEMLGYSDGDKVLDDDVELDTDEEGKVSGKGLGKKIAEIASNVIKTVFLKPLGKALVGLGDSLSKAISAVEKAVAEQLLNEDATGFNREQMLQQAFELQEQRAKDVYGDTGYTVKSLDIARDQAIAAANMNRNNVGIQNNTIVPTDYIGNYLTYVFLQVYSIDDEYVDDVINHYNYFGAYIDEYRKDRVVRDTGNYYFFKGTISKSDKIAIENLVILNQYYSTGVRLYNSTDPNIFGKL